MFTCLNYLLDNGFLELIFKLENSLKISGLLSVTFIKKLNFQYDIILINDRHMIYYFALLQFKFSALCVWHYWSKENFNFN